MASVVVAVQVVRTAVVERYAETEPRRAAAVWPSNPQSELWLALTDIGNAARQRQQIGESAIAPILDAARKAPLAPEPFLVRGIQAQLGGDQRLAEEAYRAASLRDGRSIPARYFLAEHYFRAGDAARGLRELAVLARLVPNGVSSLAPYVAAYARDPRNGPHMRVLFKSDPQLEDAALLALASDPRNADLILALWSRRQAAGENPPWAVPLVANLVRAGDYAKAWTAWARIARVPPGPKPPVFDAQFRGSSAPPPFNWSLTSSTVGLAEGQPGGQLHAIFYGQDDGVLASQLLLLKPGTYRLRMRMIGQQANPRSLSWTVTCDRSNATLLALPLGDSATAARGAVFTVPQSCRAQKLELVGRSGDMPQQSDVTIGDLTLTAARNG